MPRGNDLERLQAALPEEWKDVPILSYSQLQVIDRCDFLWYVKYGLKLNSKQKKERLDIGSFGHLLLQDLFLKISEGMTQQEWVEHRLGAMVMGITDTLNFEDQVQSLFTAMKVVRRYCTSDVLSGHHPVGVEQHFFVLVTTQQGHRLVLQGYVDLITVDPRGRVWVWDHKLPQKLWSPLKVKMAYQLPLYEILLRADGMAVHGTIVNQLNSYDYKNPEKEPDAKLFRRDEIVWTPIQLQNIWSEFLALVDDAFELIEGRRPARRSIRDDCVGCDIAYGCSASLMGEDIREAMQHYNDTHIAFRSMPVGSGVELELD